MEERTRLTRRDSVLVGLTLFSMFFGAGNLIFPPWLGAQAGWLTLPALAGFALSAIGLPVLGVAAVAMAGGLPVLAGRVGRRFAVGFTLLSYLAIGPCLAIPRTASTSFEMAVRPFAGGGAWLRAGYSLVFFVVAAAIALRPEKLSGILGRITGPLLLALLAAITAACLLHPPASPGMALGAWADQPLAEGFRNGYQTMDLIAALNFGIVIAANLRSRGVQDEAGLVRGTMRAGWIAGLILLAVYGSLAAVGALAGPAFPNAANGAGVLTGLAGQLFGTAGGVVMGLVFLIACLNTCIGLLSCCGAYFHELCPRVSLRGWVWLFAAASFVLSIAGLDAILTVSAPVLEAIYPVAIVLVALGLCHRWAARAPLCYPVCVAVTGVFSVLLALESGAGITIPGLHALPLYGAGLGWLVPALLGAAAGTAASFVPRKRN